jgi:hypothetical protein
VIDFANLLAELAEGLPLDATGASGVVLRVTDAELELPLETRLQASGLTATLPRGLIATGFAEPLGRLHAHFARVEGGSR